MGVFQVRDGRVDHLLMHEQERLDRVDPAGLDEGMEWCSCSWHSLGGRGRVKAGGSAASRWKAEGSMQLCDWIDAEVSRCRIFDGHHTDRGRRAGGRKEC